MGKKENLEPGDALRDRVIIQTSERRQRREQKRQAAEAFRDRTDPSRGDHGEHERRQKRRGDDAEQVRTNGVYKALTTLIKQITLRSSITQQLPTIAR